MTDIVLENLNYDLDIENKDIKLFERIENETVQKVKINVLLIKGEWFRDIEYGVPYTQSILGRRNTKSIADTFIKNAIINTEGIQSITSYSSTISSDRILEVTFSAITDSGEILDNVNVEV